MNYKINFYIIVLSSLACIWSTNAIGQNCYKTTIMQPAPFLGTGDGSEKIVLADGSVWDDLNYQYLYLYEYYPTVIFCPGSNLMILGKNKFYLTPAVKN